MQHPERFINWLVGGYRPVPAARSNGLRPSPGRNSRYDPLRQYLAERTEPVVRLTFAGIERILGVELPKSARQYRPWWVNEEAGTHVHARAWLDPGGGASATEPSDWEAIGWRRCHRTWGEFAPQMSVVPHAVGTALDEDAP